MPSSSSHTNERYGDGRRRTRNSHLSKLEIPTTESSHSHSARTELLSPSSTTRRRDRHDKSHGTSPKKRRGHSRRSPESVAQSPADASHHELVQLVVDQEKEAAKLKRELEHTLLRLEDEAQRAAELERGNRESADRFRLLNESRLSAQREAEKAAHERRLYQLQLENAKKEIDDAKEMAAQLEKDKQEAEASAARARAKARRLYQQQMVMKAREEGRRMGVEEGLKQAQEEYYIPVAAPPPPRHRSERSRSSQNKFTEVPGTPESRTPVTETATSPAQSPLGDAFVAEGDTMDVLASPEPRPRYDLQPAPVQPPPAQLPQPPPPPTPLAPPSHTKSRPKAASKSKPVSIRTEPEPIAAARPTSPRLAPSPRPSPQPSIPIEIFAIPIPAPNDEILNQEPPDKWVTASKYREIKGLAQESPPVPAVEPKWVTASKYREVQGMAPISPPDSVPQSPAKSRLSQSVPLVPPPPAHVPPAPAPAAAAAPPPAPAAAPSPAPAPTASTHTPPHAAAPLPDSIIPAAVAAERPPPTYFIIPPKPILQTAPLKTPKSAGSKKTRFPSLAKTKAQAASWYRSFSLRKKSKPVIDPDEDATPRQSIVVVDPNGNVIQGTNPPSEKSDGGDVYKYQPEPPMSWYSKKPGDDARSQTSRYSRASGSMVFVERPGAEEPSRSSTRLSAMDMIAPPAGKAGSMSGASSRDAHRLAQKLSIINEDPLSRGGTPRVDRPASQAGGPSKTHARAMSEVGSARTGKRRPSEIMIDDPNGLGNSALLAGPPPTKNLSSKASSASINITVQPATAAVDTFANQPPSATVPAPTHLSPNYVYQPIRIPQMERNSYAPSQAGSRKSRSKSTVSQSQPPAPAHRFTQSYSADTRPLQPRAGPASVRSGHSRSISAPGDGAPFGVPASPAGMRMSRAVDPQPPPPPPGQTSYMRSPMQQPPPLPQASSASNQYLYADNNPAMQRSPSRTSLHSKYDPTTYVDPAYFDVNGHPDPRLLQASMTPRQQAESPGLEYVDFKH